MKTVMVLLLLLAESAVAQSNAGIDPIDTIFLQDGPDHFEASLKTACTHVRDHANTEGLTLVVFAHGWHHGGKSDDSNLQSFRTILKGLSEKLPEGAPPLHGVYLAWHGDWKANYLFLKELSFWNRKKNSLHIGANAAYQTLCALAAIESEVRSRNQPFFMVTVGHSFGAGLVLAALSREIVDYGPDDCKLHGCMMALEQPAVANRFPRIVGIGDVTVLLNPAVEAERYMPYEALLKSGLAPPDDQQLVLLAIASEGDIVVRFFFPIARYISGFFKRKTWYTWHADRTALGWFMPQVTHHLDMVDGRPCLRASSEEKIGSGLAVPCRINEARREPFIVARASVGVVKNHNDIFEPRLVSFLSGVVADRLHPQSAH